MPVLRCRHKRDKMEIEITNATKQRVLKELVSRLNGNCSEDLHTCPAFIEADLSCDETEEHHKINLKYQYCKKQWCPWCEKNFGFLYHEYTHKYNKEKCIPSCPCCTAKNPEDVINRLNEIMITGGV